MTEEQIQPHIPTDIERFADLEGRVARLYHEVEGLKGHSAKQAYALERHDSELVGIGMVMRRLTKALIEFAP